MGFFKKIQVLTSDNVLKLVEEDGMALEYVVQQTGEIKWAAVKQNAMAYQFVKDPCPKMVMYGIGALHKQGRLQEYIKNAALTDEEKLQIVRLDGHLLGSLGTCSENVILESLLSLEKGGNFNIVNWVGSDKVRKKIALYHKPAYLGWIHGLYKNEIHCLIGKMRTNGTLEQFVTTLPSSCDKKVKMILASREDTFKWMKNPEESIIIEAFRWGTWARNYVNHLPYKLWAKCLHENDVVTRKDIRCLLKNKPNQQSIAILRRLYKDNLVIELNTLPEEVICELLRIDPQLIKDVYKQTKAIQMVIAEDGYMYRYLKYPLPDVSLKALERRPSNIRYIEKPSRRMIEFLLQYEPRYLIYVDVPLDLQEEYRDSYVIQYIRNGSVEIQQSMIEDHDFHFTRFMFPDENLLMYYLINAPTQSLRYFCVPNMCKKAQMFLLQNVRNYKVENLYDLNSIRDSYFYILEPPCEEVQRMIARYRGHIITIPDASETVLMELVTENGMYLQDILRPKRREYFFDGENKKYSGLFVQGDICVKHEIYQPVVSEEVLIAAVTQNPEALQFIDNPSEEVKKAAGVNVY